MNTIEQYMQTILVPILQRYHVSFDHILYTTSIVRMQMESLIGHWNDRLFRNTVLLFGAEEGTFYEPASSKLDIRKFVVVTIRNSPIETIQSDACSKAGLDNPLPNEAVKEITSSAISFFNKQNFEVLCKEIQLSSENDFYYDVLSHHPISWQALTTLASSSAKAQDYSPYNASVPFQLDELLDYTAEESIEKLSSVVYDAYEGSIEAPLCRVLKQFEEIGDSFFIIDSFKGLSRNFKKEIQAMEYLLSRGHAFVTANYYLQNGHVEQRPKLLRAGHSVADYRKNLSQVDTLGYRHKSALKQYLK